MLLELPVFRVLGRYYHLSAPFFHHITWHERILFQLHKAANGWILAAFWEARLLPQIVGRLGRLVLWSKLLVFSYERKRWKRNEKNREGVCLLSWQSEAQHQHHSCAKFQLPVPPGPTFGSAPACCGSSARKHPDLVPASDVFVWGCWQWSAQLSSPASPFRTSGPPDRLRTCDTSRICVVCFSSVCPFFGSKSKRSWSCVTASRGVSVWHRFDHSCIPLRITHWCNVHSINAPMVK